VVGKFINVPNIQYTMFTNKIKTKFLQKLAFNKGSITANNIFHRMVLRRLFKNAISISQI
jgi:hypothetical protein